MLFDTYFDKLDPENLPIRPKSAMQLRAEAIECWKEALETIEKAGQAAHVIQLVDFDCTLAVPHVYSTATEVKTDAWYRDVALGSPQRIDLIRSWFHNRATKKDYTVILSFGTTAEILHILRLHGLNEYVSRIYGRTSADEIVMDVWLNPSLTLACPILPVNFTVGPDINGAYDKSAILLMMQQSLNISETHFFDDDASNLRAVTMLALENVRTDIVGTIEAGMTQNQLQQLVRLSSL
jgi:hypothetical protein